MVIEWDTTKVINIPMNFWITYFHRTHAEGYFRVAMRVHSLRYNCVRIAQIFIRQAAVSPLFHLYLLYLQKSRTLR